MISKSDPEQAAGHIRKGLALIGKTITTIQFTSEYQRIGVISPAWHDVSECINSALKYSTLGTVRLENEIPSGTEIYADPLIENVIFNLIDNALRYGSTLTTIRFRFVREGSTTLILCEDDGIGIPPDEKELIFSYGHGTNTGMGLFLVREILAITGITIRETGIPGKGARFEILIPPEECRTR
jgi:signal transduction histidine kinase